MKNLVLFLILQMALGSNLFKTTGGSCCSKCAESKSVASMVTPDKFKKLVINAVKYNFSQAQLISFLRSFPPDYTVNLLWRTLDIKQRVEAGFASCSENVEGTKQLSYSKAKPSVVKGMILSIKRTILANKRGYSSNFVGTVTNMLDKIDKFYETLKQNDPSSFTYMGGDPIVAQQRASTVGMAYSSSFLLRIKLSEQVILRDYFNDLPTSCNVEFFDVEKCSNVRFQQEDRYMVLGNENSTLFSKKVFKFVPNATMIMNDDYASPTQRYDDTILFKYAPTTNQKDTVTTFKVPLQAKTKEEKSILDPQLFGLLNELPFDGRIYSSPNSKLNIQSGYAPGENAVRIWADITTSMLAPYVYCKYPNIVESLRKSCPVTCEITC